MTLDACDLFLLLQPVIIACIFFHVLHILMSALVVESQSMGRRIYACAMTQPRREFKAKYEPGSPQWSGHPTLVNKFKYSFSHSVRLPAPTTSSLTHHHGSLAKIHPPVNKSCTLPVSTSSLQLRNLENICCWGDVRREWHRKMQRPPSQQS